MDRRKTTWGLVIVMIILLILYFSTCTGGKRFSSVTNQPFTETYHLIPSDATFIAVFNTFTLLDDMEFEDFRKSDAYLSKLRPFYDSNPTFSFVFANPAGCGINTTKDVSFYIEVGDKAEDVHSASILNILSEEAFTSIVRQTTQSIKRSDAGFRYARIDDMSTVAWDGDFAIFLSADPSADDTRILQNIFRRNTQKYYTTQELFSNFADTSKASMVFWLDMDSYEKNQLHATDKRGYIPASLIKDSYLYGDVHFERGHVSINFMAHVNERVQKLFRRIFKSQDPFDTWISLPDRDPGILASGSLDIEGLIQFLLDDIETRIAARNYLVDYGLVLDDLTKAFSGNLIFIGYPKPGTQKTSVLMAFEIADQAHFETLLKVWEDLEVISEEEENVYRLAAGTVDFFPLEYNYPDAMQRMFIHDKTIYVSLDSSIIEGIRMRSRNTPPVKGEKYEEWVDNLRQGALFSVYGNGNPPLLTGRKHLVQSYRVHQFPGRLNIDIELQRSDIPAIKQLLDISQHQTNDN